MPFRVRPFRTLYYIGPTCVRIGHSCTYFSAVRRAGAWCAEAAITLPPLRGKGFIISTIIEDIHGNVLHNIDGVTGDRNATFTTTAAGDND